MSFLSSVVAAILEWIIAKVATAGIAEVKEVESEKASADKAKADSLALARATDKAGRVASLEQINTDTFNETTSGSDPKSTSH